MEEKDQISRMQNLTVEEFTTPCDIYVHPGDKIQEAEKIMNKEDIRHLPVLDQEKKIVGIISERDVYFSYRTDPGGEGPVEQVMQKDPYCIPSDTKISEVALHMSKNKYGSAVILNSDGSLGIFTSTDALNALIEVVRGDLQ